MTSGFYWNWYFSRSNFAKTEVLCVWNCWKYIIFDLWNFENCHFQEIHYLLFGRKIQTWEKSHTKVWLLKKLIFNCTKQCGNCRKISHFFDQKFKSWFHEIFFWMNGMFILETLYFHFHFQTRTSYFANKLILTKIMVLAPIESI